MANASKTTDAKARRLKRYRAANSQFCFFMPPKVKKRLDRLAKEKGKSRAKIIIELLSSAA